MRTKVRSWLHGLIGGAIGGGANAVCATLGIAGAEALGAPVRALDFKQMGIVFLSGFFVSIFLYLKQSPLPPPPVQGETGFLGKDDL